CEKQPTNCWLLFNNFSNNLLCLNAMFHCSPPVAHWTKPGFTKPHSIQLSFACFTILFILYIFGQSFSLLSFLNSRICRSLKSSTLAIFFSLHCLLFAIFFFSTETLV